MHMHTPSTPLQQYHTRVAAATRTQSRTAPARHSPITLKKMRIGTAAPSSPIAMASYRSHIASATLTDHTARALAKSFCASNMGLGHARCDAEIQDGRHFSQTIMARSHSVIGVSVVRPDARSPGCSGACWVAAPAIRRARAQPAAKFIQSSAKRIGEASAGRPPKSSSIEAPAAGHPPRFTMEAGRMMWLPLRRSCDSD